MCRLMSGRGRGLGGITLFVLSDFDVVYGWGEEKATCAGR